MMTAASGSKTKDTFSRTVVAPISALVALMILAVIAAAIWVAQRQTSDVLAHERSLAASALAERRSVLEKTTDDYAYWDDAYRNAAQTLDAAWIDANVARPVGDKYAYRLVSVVDAAGLALFGARGDLRFSGPLDHVLSGGFHDLLGQAARPDGADTVSGVLMFRDAPALVAISRLRPFLAAPGAEPARAEGPARFLVFVDALEAAQLRAIAGSYLLPDLRVAKTDAGPASIAVRSVDGTATLHLAWTGSDPGGAMLASMLPILVALLIAFAGLTGYVLAQGKAAAERLRDSERRAMLDPLTGMPNRIRLFARVEELLGADGDATFALAYLDLDGFKQVNDELGHDAGDEVLRQTTRRMAAAIRREDLLARIGGDEFAIVLPGLVDPPAVRQLAERVIEGVNEPLVIAGSAIRIGVSVGVAVAPADGRETLALIRAADAALYRAKRQNKGTVQFSLSAQSA